MFSIQREFVNWKLLTKRLQGLPQDESNLIVIQTRVVLFELMHCKTQQHNYGELLSISLHHSHIIFESGSQLYPPKSVMLPPWQSDITNQSWSSSAVLPFLRKMPWNSGRLGWFDKSLSTINSSSISSRLSVIDSSILTATFFPVVLSWAL